MRPNLYLLAALPLGCGAAEKPRQVPGTPRAVQAIPVTQIQAPLLTPALGATQSPASAVRATRLMGRVRSVAVAEGDRMQRGQVLASLKDGDWRAWLAQALPQESLDQAETQYARA